MESKPEKSYPEFAVQQLDPDDAVA